MRVLLGVPEVNDTKNKESQYVVSIILLLSIYSFFGYLLPEKVPYIILVFSMVAFIFYFFMNKKIVISQQQTFPILLLIIFIVIQLILARYSIFPSGSTKVAISRGAILAIGALIYMQGNWYRNGIKFLLIFSCIHASFTIISYFMPTLFHNFILPVLPNYINSEISFFISRGVYSGITDQVGRNAFYISVGISVLFGKLVANKQTSFNFEYIILGFLLLSILLTGKRGHLVANFFSMLLVSSIYAKFKGKSFLRKLLKTALVLFLAVWILILLFPEAAAPFMRFVERQGGDITSGRIPLYINAIELFKQKPILGWGCGVFSNLYEIGTHNLYLQLLAENGLIGFLLFFSILIINLKNTFKTFKRNVLHNRSQYTNYLVFSLYIQIFYLIYGITGNPLNDGFILIIYLIASSIPYTLKSTMKISARAHQMQFDVVKAY